MHVRPILALMLIPALLCGCNSARGGLPDWVREDPAADPALGSTASPGAVSLTRAELERILSGSAGVRRSQPVRRASPRRSNVMIFDVHDLLRAQPDFVAPEINVLTSDADYEPGSVRLSDAFMDEDTLLNLIRDTIRPGTWDESGNSVHISNGKIFVTRRPEPANPLR